MIPDVAGNHRLNFEGVFNFRDLGGYQTRHGRTIRRGRLFRSDSIHHMTARDNSYAREELGIRTVIDLRTPKEVREQGSGLLALPPVARYHFSLVQRNGATDAVTGLTSSEKYLRMLSAGGSQIARAVTLLAKAETCPAVFYCWAGKDRTGVLAAVILGALGVEDDVIVQDYETTNRNLGQNREAVIERARRDYQWVGREVQASDIQAKPEAMKEVLLTVRKGHGSIRGYLRSIGVSERSLRRLEETLLMP